MTTRQKRQKALERIALKQINGIDWNRAWETSVYFKDDDDDVEIVRTTLEKMGIDFVRFVGTATRKPYSWGGCYRRERFSICFTAPGVIRSREVYYRRDLDSAAFVAYLIVFEIIRLGKLNIGLPVPPVHPSMRWGRLGDRETRKHQCPRCYEPGYEPLNRCKYCEETGL